MEPERGLYLVCYILAKDVEPERGLYLVCYILAKDVEPERGLYLVCYILAKDVEPERGLYLVCYILAKDVEPERGLYLVCYILAKYWIMLQTWSQSEGSISLGLCGCGHVASKICVTCMYVNANTLAGRAHMRTIELLNLIRYKSGNHVEIWK